MKVLSHYIFIDCSCSCSLQ